MEQLSDHVRILERLCKLEKKWGMYAQGSPLFENIVAVPQKTTMEEGRAMVSWMDHEYFFQFMWNEFCIVLGTQEEIEDAYARTHGDDGPHDIDADGRCRLRDVHIYAITCDDTGQCRNENT